MKKILLVITLALSISVVGTYAANKTEEKAIESQPTPTPYIVSDPTGGGI